MPAAGAAIADFRPMRAAHATRATIALLALAMLACTSPPSKDEEPEWLRKSPAQIDAAGPVEIPEDAVPLEGAFHITRESFSLEGSSTVTLWSDGRIEGTRETTAPAGPADPQLTAEEITILRQLAAALIALPRDEYVDPEIRDGLRVRYTLHRSGTESRTVTCANELPPAVRGLEQLTHRHVPSDW